MGDLRRKAGFASAISNAEVGELLWPEGALALLIGLGGGSALFASTTVEERVQLVGDGLTPLGVLLGVVFAAFALLIALFSGEYVRALNTAEDGVIAFLRPFMLAVGTQVTAVFVALIYRVAGPDLAPPLEGGLFLVWALIFSFALVDVVALARTVTMHGLSRAEQIEKRDAGTHPSQDRRPDPPDSRRG